MKDIYYIEVKGDKEILSNLIINTIITPDSDEFLSIDKIEKSRNIHSISYKGKKTNNSFKDVAYFTFYISYRDKAEEITIENYLGNWSFNGAKKAVILEPYFKNGELYIFISQHYDGKTYIKNDYKIENNLKSIPVNSQNKFTQFFW